MKKMKRKWDIENIEGERFSGARQGSSKWEQEPSENNQSCQGSQTHLADGETEARQIRAEPTTEPTTQPTTKPAVTTANNTDDGKSCSGFTAIGAVLALVAVTGAAIVIKKK